MPMFKILIVDDDEDLLKALSRLLQLRGFDIHGLSEPDKVFVIVESFKPDLIILDVALCELDGRDICRKLKLNPETKVIKIVLYSANHDLEYDYNQYGADAFVKKPFQSALLYETIENHLKE